ncbi:MAG: hypothetical protein ACR2LM_17930 [Pyrinomonadaceae bacterium]
MANEHIAIYLNDHLAGSVVALELLEHLEETHSGTPLERFFKELRSEITADREKLETLMDQLDIAESRTRKASAWLTEKVTALKLRLDDPADGDLRLFESLEALSLGIEGKRGLWLALSEVAKRAPHLQLLDYQELIRRADTQRSQVEEKRLETAKRALVGTK